jgi:hypothetical protein
MKAQTVRPATITDESVGAVLSRVHKVWLHETRRFVRPATVPGASFWVRWSAVRYLADQFLGQYRRERALVDELRPFLPPRVFERLCRDGERIGDLQLRLDTIGRRRGTAPQMAGESRELLRLLRRWCTEIERGASGLSQSVLPAEATRLVAELQMFGRLHA